MVIVINVFMVVASTVVGGYMVETAQATAGSGRLTAIRQFVQQGCVIVNGPVAGYLASIAFGWTAGACGGIMFLLVPVTALFLREQRQRRTRRSFWACPQAVVTIATARTMWAAAGLMALFYIAPGFATAVFYSQQNDLHMDTQAQGFLQLISGVFGVLAAVGLRGPVPAVEPAGRCWSACMIAGDGREPGVPVLLVRGTGAGDRGASTASATRWPSWR